MPYQINGYDITNYMITTSTDDGKGIRTYYQTFPFSVSTNTTAQLMLNTGFKYGPTNLDLGMLGLAATSYAGALNSTVPVWCNRICAIGVGGGGGGGGGGNNDLAANGGNGGWGGYGAMAFTPTSGTVVISGTPIVISIGNGGGGGAGGSGASGTPGNASNVVVNGTNIMSAGGGNAGNGGNNAPSGFYNGNSGSPSTPGSASTLPSGYPTELSSFGTQGAAGGAGGGNGGNGGVGQVRIWYKYG